jgi:hypothetical protein
MWSVDFDPLVCPSKPICDPYVNGMVVRWDAAHLTIEFGLTLVDDIVDAFEDGGVLDP